VLVNRKTSSLAGLTRMIESNEVPSATRNSGLHSVVEAEARC
jgi:hypothetical protein